MRQPQLSLLSWRIHGPALQFDAAAEVHALNIEFTEYELAEMAELIGDVDLRVARCGSVGLAVCKGDPPPVVTVTDSAGVRITLSNVRPNVYELGAEHGAGPTAAAGACRARRSTAVGPTALSTRRREGPVRNARIFDLARPRIAVPFPTIRACALSK